MISNLIEATSPLLGYLDPGSGSLLVQTIVGGLLGLLLSVRLYWRDLKARGLRLFRRPDDPDPA